MNKQVSSQVGSNPPPNVLCQPFSCELCNEGTDTRIITYQDLIDEGVNAGITLSDNTTPPSSLMTLSVALKGKGGEKTRPDGTKFVATSADAVIWQNGVPVRDLDAQGSFDYCPSSEDKNCDGYADKIVPLDTEIHLAPGSIAVVSKLYGEADPLAAAKKATESDTPSQETKGGEEAA